MSDVKIKVYQVLFPLGSVPDPAGKGYNAHPDLLAVFKSSSLKERGRSGTGGVGKKRGGKGESKGVDGKGGNDEEGRGREEENEDTRPTTAKVENEGEKKI